MASWPEHLVNDGITAGLTVYGHPIKSPFIHGVCSDVMNRRVRYVAAIVSISALRLQPLRHGHWPNPIALRKVATRGT